MLPRWLSILKYERRGARINEKLCIFGQQIFSGALDKHRASFAHASTLLLHNFLLHVIILNHSHQGTLLAKYPFTFERVAAIVSVHTMTVLQTVMKSSLVCTAIYLLQCICPYRARDHVEKTLDGNFRRSFYMCLCRAFHLFQNGLVSVPIRFYYFTITMTKVIFKAPFITISRGPYVTSRAMHFAFTIFAFVTISRKA